jgi:hypothetical protein
MFAWLKRILHLETTAMTDEVVEPVAAAPVVVPATTDLAKLKALLVAAGHAIEADWDHLVAVATK